MIIFHLNVCVVVNNLSLQYETPEPQYTETKSSILRRRNSIAKLNSRFIVLLLCIRKDLEKD